jgi:hypothetical protein
MVAGLLAAATPSARAESPVSGTASDLSLIADIRAGWPEVGDLYVPSELPEGWWFSRAGDLVPWPDVDFANPRFAYVPMGDPEAVCAYALAYTNGHEAIEVSAGYWPASGASGYFHEQAESSTPVDIYLGGEQWRTFTYADPPYDPGHEVLFVEWDNSAEGAVCYVEIDYRDTSTRTTAEAIAKAIVQVARISPFSDVPDTSEDIIVLAREGIVQGYPDGTFRPENAVLRAQFAKMLIGALRLEVSEGSVNMPFRDVERPADDLYPDDYVATAYRNGIVGGFNATTFGPYQPVTRIQMISMVVRALERIRPGRLVQPPAGWNGFEHPEVNNPAHGANVRLAEFNGLLSRWLYNWDLYLPATRGEMAQVLWDALGDQFDGRLDGIKSSKTLDQVETELRSDLDPSASIYLPAQLPTAWAVADVPLPPDAQWDLPRNPEVSGGEMSYKVAFTNGSSVVTLWTNSDLADPGEASTGDLPTDLMFEGESVGMLYMGGAPVAFSFTKGMPRGWILTGSNPWDRDSVLEFASVMKRLR